MNSVWILWKHFFPQKSLETEDWASTLGLLSSLFKAMIFFFLGWVWNLCFLVSVLTSWEKKAQLEKNGLDDKFSWECSHLLPYTCLRSKILFIYKR